MESSRFPRKSLAVAIAALTFYWLPPGLAQEAPTAEKSVEQLRLEIRKSIRRLNDPELSERDVAEQALVDLGPKILDLLPPPSPRMPAEIKHRLGRVRQKLEEQLAEAAAQPTRVSISGKGLALADVMAAIEKQTGNKLVDQRVAFGADPKQLPPIGLDLDFENEPFWPALDRICDLAGMAIDHFSSEGTLPLAPRIEGQVDRSARAVYAGPFRFEAISVVARRDLRSAAGQNLTVNLEVAWEPRLAPIALTLPLDAVQAVDENGKPLPADAGRSEFQVEVATGATHSELPLGFALPPRDVTKIASLRGKLIALVPGRIETFRFDDIRQAKTVEQRKGRATVVLDAVRENNELWEVRMRVSFDEASGSLQSHRGWVYRNECYLVGPKDKRIEHAGFETTRQTENEVGIAYLFDLPDGPEGLSFVYKTAAAILKMPVEFELKDIALP